MVMPEKDETKISNPSGEEVDRVTTQASVTRTVEHNVPPVQIINQAEKSIPAQLIDSLANASKSASINNLLLLSFVVGAFAVGWRILPSIVDVLHTMNTHIPVQTKLLEEQNVTMTNIQKENNIRDKIQSRAVESQNNQTKAIAEVEDLQKKALDNHAKIIENQTELVRQNRVTVELLSKINSMIERNSIPIAPIQPSNKP